MRFVAGPEDAGDRVDVAVTKRGQVARTKAQEALRSGTITVNGRAEKPGYRLVEGDVVEGGVAEVETSLPEAEDIPLVVRYEDARVLVISKPAGLVTHPGHGNHTGTLVHGLLGRGTPLSGIGTERPGIVHRLDKDTSGLMLVAKDDEAQESLQRDLRERLVERRYLSLVRGVVSSATGTIDAPLGRHPQRRRLMAIVPDGRSAITHFSVLATTDKVSFLDVKLETGRTHQIRVHLAHLGHPVLGDRPYGGRGELATGLGLDRPFLHAWSLRFQHPGDRRVIEIREPLPARLAEALEAAGLQEAVPSI